MPQDPGAGGKAAAHEIVRLLAGFAVTIEPVTGSKMKRAEPFAAQVNAGNVALVDAEWTTDYEDELASFPTGKHDDQVDASSDSFRLLVEEGGVRSWVL